MEQNKTRKCVIRLNRVTPANVDDIREQMQVRRCFVRLQRFDNTNSSQNGSPALNQTRRLRVRLERMNFNGSRSDISSTASVISGHIFSEDEDDVNGPANQTL